MLTWQAQGTLAQPLRPLSARIFSIFNDAFGYHNARLPAGPARCSFTVRRGHLKTIFLPPNARMRSELSDDLRQVRDVPFNRRPGGPPVCLRRREAA